MSRRKWLKSLKKKFRRSTHRGNKDIVYSYTVPKEEDEDDDEVEVEVEGVDSKLKQKEEEIAAIKIQATFRGHLARRAFKALRSLVKLQALARGAYVRKQTQLALHCMQALVRLQIRVRARQILGSFHDSTPKHLI